MADFNPTRPTIVGNEWVPIRSEPGPLSFEDEIGSTFTVTGSAVQVTTGRFYLDLPPPGPSTVKQVLQMAVYQRGREGVRGPVQQVTIPVNGGTVTSPAALRNTSSLPAAVASPGGSPFVNMPPGGQVDLRFAVSGAPQLAGKRILAVDLVYLATSTTPPVGFSGFVDIRDPDVSFYQYGALEVTPNSNVQQVSVMPLGEINPWHLGDPDANSRRYPWIHSQLQRLEAATGTLSIRIRPGDVTTSLRYAALRVTYCEETRLAVGGFITAVAATDLVAEGNSVELRVASTLAAGAVNLGPGDYTVTVGLAVEGPNTLLGVRPQVRRLRQLYPLPGVTGVVVPKPRDGRQPVAPSTTNVVPQLTVHTAAAVVAGCNPFGTQLQVPVYDGVNAMQQVATAAGSGAPYPQVRFYARRFGQATVPLTVANTADATMAAEISPEEFDELPEIVDGWREVTLTFGPNVPTIGPEVGTMTFEFSAAGELPENQWQILAARANGGAAGNLPLDPATYDGASSALTWDHPTVAGPSNRDTPADATLLLAQALPVIEDLAVSEASVAVEGIGLDCDDLPPRSIPVGVLSHQLTWTPPPAMAGFGTVEIQRQDDVDTDWHTVMACSERRVAVFFDYEARVGVESRYRARVTNSYGFAGPWSPVAAATLTAPGVVDTLPSGGPVLLFTSNARQDGSASLAYRMAFDGSPSEDFTFLEAEQTVLQRMYERDYQVAFRGRERGGEQFSRTVLVQAAAVPPPSLANMRSLRDLAWADLPYVCVRDELGNRWLAAVAVPSGSVRNRRRLYLARIDVVEVTNVPFPVDPAVA